VPQAVFPEGGLTRDGRLREPKLGAIDYMMRGFRADGERDLVFIPLGINYDRVLEDRALLAEAAGEGKAGALGAGVAATRFALRNAVLWVLGRWHRFGYACVNFGTPVSARAWLRARGLDLRALGKEERQGHVEAFGMELMAAVGRVVPVLPVSLVATALLEAPGPVAGLELHRRTQGLMRRLAASGAQVYLPRSDEEYASAVGLRMLTLRRLVEERDGGWVPAPGGEAVLRYYARSIAHLVGSPIWGH
jgi:glycerol-3-phosphate O-acyltransferase